MADQIRLLVERTNLRTILLAICFAIVGILTLGLSHHAGALEYHRTEAVLREAGAVLLISGVFTAIWEFAGKRAFADEVLAKAGMSRDLADAGIEIVCKSFQDERVRWDLLFKNACKLDIFVAYASTWRNTQIQRIDKLLSEADARLRVILPDPQSNEVMQILATRFESTPERIREEVNEAKEFFLHRKSKGKGTTEIYFTSVVPVFSFYRFSNKAVLALYNHREGRIPVPALVCDEDGFLFEYLTNEFEGIVGNEHTKRVDS
jgi:hypothetical protein